MTFFLHNWEQDKDAHSVSIQHFTRGTNQWNKAKKIRGIGGNKEIQRTIFISKGYSHILNNLPKKAIKTNKWI